MKSILRPDLTSVNWRIKWSDSDFVVDGKREMGKDSSSCVDYRRLSKEAIMQVYIGFIHRSGLYGSEHAHHSWFDPQHNCRVRWSHETGAEMKRLAGELGCVCSRAVVTGLWYFSKDFWARVLLIFLGGSCRCVHNRKRCCLCDILARCVPHRYLFAGVITWSVIDVAAQQVSASFYLNIINVTLTVQT